MSVKYAVLLAAFSMNVGAADVLTITTEDLPPFAFSRDDGKTITGASTELVIEMFKRAAQSYTLSMYPWVRAYRMAQKNSATCVYPTARVPDREAQFTWVGPIGSNDQVLFARAGTTIHVTTLEDARRYRIGAHIGSTAADYLREHGITPDESPSERLNAKKLEIGHIDLWAANQLPALWMSKEEGIADLQLVLLLRHNELYLACSKDVSEDKIKTMNRVLREMGRDGTSSAIMKKYN
jgi:polar amino acid transport system substrate-binding protein